MIKQVLEHIGGVGAYGVLSISIFFAFFIGVLVWAARMKKSHLNTMSQLPLEDSAPQNKPESDCKP
ncbi:MAG: CcoQ/FixQ family Cbb3-type cytochrome c oxidase assembly chaperone [Verrucomicrobia bacterium]|nr:CcoQ/FixQ family Cbb3-type cytochrome c oxidase assembly chaperone [Verrucomicrobiota bacterium]